MNEFNIENEFVTYEIALKCRELGFEKECIAYYNGFNIWLSNKPCNFSDTKIGVSKSVWLKSWINAPLWQQAFDWLFDQFGVYINVPNNITPQQKSSLLESKLKILSEHNNQLKNL